MRVLMIPGLSRFENTESGIKRVVEAYHKYAASYGIEYVECPVEDEHEYDLFAVHAGSSDRFPVHRPLVAIAHGLYWTADYDAHGSEWDTNAHVIETIRRATMITVPSPWVAETIRRDCRVDPVILPHGINWKEWEHNEPNAGYVLWNKNRPGDVCTPEHMMTLAEMRPNVNFLTTFAAKSERPDASNIAVTGVQPHNVMKKMIQQAGVYLSTTKETFGIGVLEAMAAGTPVLGFAYGGNKDLIEHGVTGYLARPGDYDDLANGLDYCLKHRGILSDNCKIEVQKLGWNNPARILASVYEQALRKWEDNQRPLKIDPESYLTS